MKIITLKDLNISVKFNTLRKRNSHVKRENVEDYNVFITVKDNTFKVTFMYLNTFISFRLKR